MVFQSKHKTQTDECETNTIYNVAEKNETSRIDEQFSA